MKKSIITLMFFLPLLCFAQSNDTIFFTNGTFEVVYRVDVQYNGRVYYTPIKGAEQLDVRSYLVDRIGYNIERKLKPALNENVQSDSIESNTQNPKIITELGLLQYEVTPIQYNLHRFYRQQRLSHILMGVSLLSGVAYGVNPLDDVVLAYVSGGLALISLVIDIDSYKWIKRASLETSTNGVTLRVNF